jgi:hypothetical protein
MMWVKAGKLYEKRFDNELKSTRYQVGGGSELSQLIADADAHLVEMRNIVQ